ncbi:hypothetical protein OBBRIDRAFT_888505 [Obba rivulosa]|uniref:Uncharacterized protein n=1 Tax=Obba rivulosa TaxID=1052685 RepID=A0A8E2AQX3_9APHY|nr:hypothetical protein OBBRIDRAFT_888505 [Obba rivulosa]
MPDSACSGGMGFWTAHRYRRMPALFAVAHAGRADPLISRRAHLGQFENRVPRYPRSGHACPSAIAHEPGRSRARPLADPSPRARRAPQLPHTQGLQVLPADPMARTH